jgi:hypothetical protein
MGDEKKNACNLGLLAMEYKIEQGKPLEVTSEWIFWY